MKLSATHRKIIITIAIAGVAGAVLFLPAIYAVGLWLSPPRNELHTPDPEMCISG